MIRKLQSSKPQRVAPGLKKFSGTLGSFRPCQTCGHHVDAGMYGSLKHDALFHTKQNPSCAQR